jgi:transposase-like protein
MPCPHCRSNGFWSLRRSHARCKNCRREYSLCRNLVSGMRSSEREWRKIIDAVLDDHSVRDIAEDLRISTKTAQEHIHLIRSLLVNDCERGFSGIVEADETYMGPKWSNRRSFDKGFSRRRRGTDNTPVFGLLERKSGLVYATVVPSVKALHLLPHIFRIVRRGSSIFSDTSTSYGHLRRHGYHHKTVDHAGGEYVRGIVSTNRLEGFWGWMKRRHKVRGGIRNDRLDLFVGSWTWIYNHRHESRRDQMKRVIKLIKMSSKVGGKK